MRYWGRVELRALWERRVAGERTDDLAAENGIEGRTLRKHWRVHLGADLRRLRDAERKSPHAATIYRLRLDERLPYKDIAERLGFEDPSYRGRRRCYSILRRYCGRVGCRMPPPIGRVYTCSACGGSGHDVRSCSTSTAK